MKTRCDTPSVQHSVRSATYSRRLRLFFFIGASLASLMLTTPPPAFAQNQPASSDSTPATSTEPETTARADRTKEKDRPFLVFSALMHNERPDLSRFGIHRLSMVYAQTLWDGKPNQSMPRENTVRTIARQLHRRGNLVCIDIEHWRLFDDDKGLITENLKKYQRLADWFRSTHPGLRIGYYGTLPTFFYHRMLDQPDQVRRWRRRNRKLDVLARHVDVIYPSLYTRTKNRDQWRRVAVRQIRAARRLGAQVYVFLWPRYFHDSDRRIEPAYWRLQLRTVYRHADGVVLWGGYQQQWDPDAGWWQATKSFMRNTLKN